MDADQATSIAVGGGLAGAAFALELARHGERACIIEKTPGIHHKVCGEFLSAEAQALIGYLGVNVETLGAASVTRFRLACDDRFISCALPFRGAGLSRARLDEALLAAAATAGADLVRGVRVSRLQHGDSSVSVDAAKYSFRTGHAALSTGKHDLRGWPRPRAPILSFKIQLRLTGAATADMREIVQLALFRGGYAGLCLVEDDIATACWVVDRSRLRGSIEPEWPAQCRFLVRQSSLLGDLLQGAQPLMERPIAVSSIPYGFLRTDVIARSIYPLGDQLAVIPSFTGDGTSIALYSGILAAQAVLNGRAASEFQSFVLSQLRPQMRWARLTNLIFAHAPIQRTSVAVAQGLPVLASKLIALLAKATRLKAGAGLPFAPPRMPLQRSAAMK